MQIPETLKLLHKSRVYQQSINKKTLIPINRFITIYRITENLQTHSNKYTKPLSMRVVRTVKIDL